MEKNTLPVVHVINGRQKKLLQGHPWVYGNEIERVEGETVDGELVTVVDFRGRYMGTGFFNSKSLITVRLLTHRQEEITDSLIASRVKAALETVGLSRHAEERAGIFSRGMAQRLNLARLMLAEPQLILLDEPATGLDVASRRILLDLMLEARARGAAILWISHDVEEDARHADFVFTLKDRSLTMSAGGAAC